MYAMLMEEPRRQPPMRIMSIIMSIECLVGGTDAKTDRTEPQMG